MTKREKNQIRITVKADETETLERIFNWLYNGCIFTQVVIDFRNTDPEWYIFTITPPDFNLFNPPLQHPDEMLKSLKFALKGANINLQIEYTQIQENNVDARWQQQKFRG